jgi:hypothetical protein
MDKKNEIEEERIRRGIHQLKPPPPYKRSDKKPKTGPTIMVL